MPKLIETNTIDVDTSELVNSMIDLARRVHVVFGKSENEKQPVYVAIPCSMVAGKLIRLQASNKEESVKDQLNSLKAMLYPVDDKGKDKFPNSTYGLTPTLAQIVKQ